MRISCLFSPAAAPYRWLQVRLRPSATLSSLRGDLKNIWNSGLGKIFITWPRGPGPSRVNLMRISHEYSYPGPDSLSVSPGVNTSDCDLISDHGPRISVSIWPGSVSPVFSPVSPVPASPVLRSQPIPGPAQHYPALSSH